MNNFEKLLSHLISNYKQTAERANKYYILYNLILIDLKEVKFYVHKI